MKTLIEILKESAAYLHENGIERSRREAEELLSHVLGLKRMDLYLQHDRPLEENEIAALPQLLARRAKNEPLQHIQGFVDFYNCQIKVDARALIPRPETEELVSKVVLELKGKEGTLVDLCCGSGCIAIAIKKACPQLQVIALDVSSKALQLAKENAQLNGVDVLFIQGDFLNPLEKRPIDYVICNPPYIIKSEIEQLQPEVRDYEPHEALNGGDDGLDFYKRLDSDLPHLLKEGGKAWLEIGASQGEQVKSIFEHAPWKSCLLKKDLTGRDRYIFLVKE